MELNNREISLLILFGIVALFGLRDSKIRTSFFNVLKVIFSDKLLVIFELNLLYILIILILLSSVGFWNFSMLKGTILWVLFTSIVLILNVFKKSEEDGFLRAIILSNFKIIVFLEYLGSLFVFDLLIELILQPVLFFITVTIGLSEGESKLAKVKVFFEVVLSILGVLLILFSIYNLFENMESIVTIDRLKDFTLPPILTLIYIPFIYILAFYGKYEIYFNRLDYINRGNPLNSYAKFRVILFCNIRLRKLIQFSRKHPTMEYKTKNDIKEIFKNFKLTQLATLGC
ncbi:MAG: hypothetical protein L3J41_16855 [Melioribacteraceae bacterium]|nr:hypothetical protein [Melioribacteraceae bacterium]